MWLECEVGRLLAHTDRLKYALCNRRLALFLGKVAPREYRVNAHRFARVRIEGYMFFSEG